MTQTGLLRVRRLLGRAGRWTVVALVVLGLLGTAAGVWAYAHPPTTTVTDRQNEQTVRSELHVSARVGNGSSLYDRGTVLRDRPVYLLPSMANATVIRETAVPEGRPVTVTQEVSLVYRVAHDGETVWRNRTVLVDAETTTESGRVVVRTPIDVDEVIDRRREIGREVGRAGSVSVVLRTNVTYRTDAYEGSLTDATPIAVGDGWYEISPTSSERTHGTPVERTVTVPNRSPWPYAVPTAFGIVFLLVGGTSAVLGRRDGSGEAIEHEIHRRRYEEWISEGRLPPNPGGEVTVASLEDLVDVAIDAGKRVIYDPEDDRYVVVDGRTWYCYRPESDDSPDRN